MERSTRPSPAMVRGYSLTTGWGRGMESLPTQASLPAAGVRILTIPTASANDDRLRRATRECVLAVQAVERAVQRSDLAPSELAGPRTGLLYASASAYAAANWAFLHADREQAVYFPYTAPSAVPGEVTIHFALTGPYLSFLSGANAGIEALWQAATLLTQHQCDRILILGVETFMGCEELYTSGRWLFSYPLVETAICLIVESHAALAEVGYNAGRRDDALELIEPFMASHTIPDIVLCLPTAREGHRLERRLRHHWPEVTVSVLNDRVGTCLASSPLIGLLLSIAREPSSHTLLVSRWGDIWSMLSWPLVI